MVTMAVEVVEAVLVLPGQTMFQVLPMEVTEFNVLLYTESQTAHPLDIRNFRRTIGAEVVVHLVGQSVKVEKVAGLAYPLPLRAIQMELIYVRHHWHRLDSMVLQILGVVLVECEITMRARLRVG